MTAKLKELREKRATIATNARAKLDEIKPDTPAERSAEINREFDAMMRDADALSEQIEREQKVSDLEARGSGRDPRRPLGENTDNRNNETDEETPAEYREIFGRVMRFGSGSLTPDEREVVMRNRPNLTQEMRAQAGSDGAAGGYTVPQEFSGEIDRAISAWGPMWDGGIVREISTATGARLPWPTIDDTDNEGHDKAENEPATDDGSDDIEFGQKALDAFMTTTGIVRISLELLQDSAFNMEALLNDIFGERMGRRANRKLTVGSGNGEARGIVPAAGLGKLAASNNAVTGDELIDFFHSVDSAYRASPKCRWQFNDSSLATVRKLKDGQGNYLWQMGDVRAGEPDQLLGKPFSVNAAMPGMTGGARPIIFGDHSRYVVRKVKGFTVMVLRERYAENFQVGMIGFNRFDGELLNSKAVKAMQMAPQPAG